MISFSLFLLFIFLPTPPPSSLPSLNLIVEWGCYKTMPPRNLISFLWLSKLKWLLLLLSDSRLSDAAAAVALIVCLSCLLYYEVVHWCPRLASTVSFRRVRNKKWTQDLDFVVVNYFSPFLFFSPAGPSKTPPANVSPGTSCPAVFWWSRRSMTRSSFSPSSTWCSGSSG